MTASREPIAVIGTGYVGLVTAAGLAELGNDVWCVDIDAVKVARLQRGEIPIHEPGLAEVVAAHRDRLHFTTDLGPVLERARLLFVAVGTPPTHSGDADLSAVFSVIDAMPAGDHHAIVMKSTVPVGTGAAIAREFEAKDKVGFTYVSCPEFLREGSAIADFRAPDRVVVGDDGGWAGDAVGGLYAPLGAPLVRTDVASAEMIKLASNAFLATKISFINEIANVCEETGADVTEVARGMGLDQRIGASFLRAGVGFGGSCLAGDETALIRYRGRTSLVRLDALWRRLQGDAVEAGRDGVIEPENLDVLAWAPDLPGPMFLPVLAVTRRPSDGRVVEVRAKTGRRVTCTADHPWVVSDGAGGEPRIRTADELTDRDWLPIALHADGMAGTPTDTAALITAAEKACLSASQLIVRPPSERIRELVGLPMAERRAVFARGASTAQRSYDVGRTGALRLDELARAGLPLEGSTLATATNGAAVTNEISLDPSFWRVVGLYLAEGHCAIERTPRGERHRIFWSFHPSREEYLVDQVVAFWLRHGVRAVVRATPTSRVVSVSSRLLGVWWTQVLGMGRTSYEQRLPDLIWDRCEQDQWALLAGLWEGDGSWSLVNGGPSVILEWGSVSAELADGVLRLLAGVGIVASQRIGRTAKSTKDTHWLRISGASQIERAVALIPERDRPGVAASMALQSKRIAPTGSRTFGEDGPAWVRVTSVESREHEGYVYSMEVVGAHTFVTTGGLVTHNCFPKDVSALKQLAGNSGYHFQLLNAVIEVNELQKRRVIAKLQKHLGSLAGKRITLLGLAFKPDTDDMREATSLVLAARLQAEGAIVCAYDPVAQQEARERLRGVAIAASVPEALADADAVVLVTEWDEFLALDWVDVAAAMAGTVVIDGRNALDPEAIRSAGLVYDGIGRP